MKTYKPVTKSTRQLATVEYRKLLSGHRPEKSLVRGKRNTGGRNAFGRITMRHRGGGHKKKYRLVDFRFDKKDVPARVASIEYDPLRSAFIGLAVYADGEKRYVVLPQRVRVGDTFLVSETAPVKPGNRLPLSKMPVGTFVYNIALRPGAKAALARSAGNYAEIVAQDAGYTHVKLPSTEVRKIIGTAWASVGEVSNEEYRLQVLGKAGRSRWMGIRPTVRGTAMNPVDHPHGGGEGKTKGGRHPVSPEGIPTKGYKTRKNKATDKYIIRRRKKK